MTDHSAHRDRSIEGYHCRFQFEARLGFSLRFTLLEGEILTPTSTSPEATVGTIAMATATRQIIHLDEIPKWPVICQIML